MFFTKYDKELTGFKITEINILNFVDNQWKYVKIIKFFVVDFWRTTWLLKYIYRKEVSHRCWEAVNYPLYAKRVFLQKVCFVYGTRIFFRACGMCRHIVGSTLCCCRLQNWAVWGRKIRVTFFRGPVGVYGYGLASLVLKEMAASNPHELKWLPVLKLSENVETLHVFIQNFPVNVTNELQP